MNILHVKYALEVVRAGSLNKASEVLLVAPPNISRSIKELEADLGITIFARTAKGMVLTPDGEEFMNYARSILAQIDHVEKLYRGGSPKKQRFSISVPRACYISEAFAEFSKSLTQDPAEIFYKETNSQRAISNILGHDYKLGIIRYAETHDKQFQAMLDEKELNREIVTEFSYCLLMSKENPLAGKDPVLFRDLTDLIEIAHADPYVPSLPLSKVMKEELAENIKRRIFLFERASQFELLSKNHETFMWVSPVPKSILDAYGLVQTNCPENRKVYRDVLIWRKGYRLSELDKRFIEELEKTKRQLSVV